MTACVIVGQNFLFFLARSAGASSSSGALPSSGPAGVDPAPGGEHPGDLRDPADVAREPLEVEVARDAGPLLAGPSAGPARPADGEDAPPPPPVHHGWARRAPGAGRPAPHDSFPVGVGFLKLRYGAESIDAHCSLCGCKADKNIESTAGDQPREDHWGTCCSFYLTALEARGSLTRRG